MKLKIGTRGSKLALYQTDLVSKRIKEKYPEIEIETVIIHTLGDKVLDKSLSEFQGKGIFVDEFEKALQDHTIDLAVHSAKDMPMELADGLALVAVLEREDCRDVLVTKKESRMVKEDGKRDDKEKIPSFDAKRCDYSVTTKSPCVIGTSSPRRAFQVKQWYPDCTIESIRGNVPTRLNKMREGLYDGVVLAVAGLKRLHLLEEEDLTYHYFDTEEVLPAGGQGIIAIEGRSQDENLTFVKDISDEATMTILETERAILQELNAGCHEPIGVYVKEIRKEDVRQLEATICGEIHEKLRKVKLSGTCEEHLRLAKQIVNCWKSEQED